MRMPEISQLKKHLVIATALLIILSACGSRNRIPNQAPQATEAPAKPMAETTPAAPPSATQADEDSIIHFAGNKTAVEDADKQKLRTHAARLKANPKLVLILLVHADSQGSRAYNLAIADKWTNSILRALRDCGVNRKQVEIRQAALSALPARARYVELLYKP